jgi:hypothetical protein
MTRQEIQLVGSKFIEQHLNLSRQRLNQLKQKKKIRVYKRFTEEGKEVDLFNYLEIKKRLDDLKKQDEPSKD